MFRIISVLWCLFLIVVLAGLLVLSGQQVLATVPHSFNNLQNGYKLYEHIAWLSAPAARSVVATLVVANAVPISKHLCLTLRYSRIDGWCTYLDYVSSSAVSLGGESDEICTPVH